MTVSKFFQILFDDNLHWALIFQTHLNGVGLAALERQIASCIFFVYFMQFKPELYVMVAHMNTIKQNALCDIWVRLATTLTSVWNLSEPFHTLHDD